MPFVTVYDGSVQRFSYICIAILHNNLNSVSHFSRIILLLVVCLSLKPTLVLSQVTLPSSIPGLTVWLSADSIEASGLEVSRLYDKSGLVNDFIQNIASNRPLIISNVTDLNNMPVLRFDGNNDGLTSNIKIGLGNQGATIFLIAKLNFHTNYGMFLCYGVNNPGSWNFRLRPIEPKITMVNGANNIGAGLNNTNSFDLNAQGFTLLSGSVNATTEKWKIAENGILKDSIFDSFTQADSNFVTIAYRNDGAFINADIAEIILFNRELDQSESMSVVQYLRNRYAPPVELGPPIKVVCDTAITLTVPDYFTQVLWSTGETSYSITLNQPDTVSVQATDIFGFVSTDTIILKTFQNVFSFSVIPDTLTCGESIIWDPGLDPVNYTYLWNTGYTTPILTIDSSGYYSVLITDTSGCNVSSPNVSVFIDQFSTTATLGNDTSFCSGDTLSLFSGIANVVSYLWQDNTTDTFCIVTNPGNYWVTAINANGCVARDTIDISIKGVNPTVDFAFNNTCKNSHELFYDISVMNDTGHAVFWVWEWGDGSSSAIGDSVHHSYNSSGTFSVSLTINTSTGCKASLEKVIIVYPNPNADFRSYTTNDPLTIGLYDNSSDNGWPINTRIWKYNNNVTSYASYYSQSFPDYGNYPISFIVVSNKGCADTINKTISCTNTSIPNIVPNEISGLNLWLRADSNVNITNNLVSGWNDISGNNNDFSTSNSLYNPLYIPSNLTINNHPSIEFDGIDDFLISDNSINLGEIGASIFFVANLHSHTNYGMYLCYGVNNPGSWNFRLRPSEPKITLVNGANNNGAGLNNINALDLTSIDFTILSGSVNSTLGKWKIAENTQLKDSLIESFVQAESNYMTIANRDNLAHVNVEIAEIILYSRELNNSENQNVYSYIRNRYAPPVELGPPIKFVCDTSMTLTVPDYFTQILWSTGETSHSITINQPDTISIQATDVFGFVSKDTIVLKSFQEKYGYYFLPDTVSCGNSILWDPGLDSLKYRYLWNTGQVTPTLTITGTANYSVIVTDTIGCPVFSPTVNVYFDPISSIIDLGPDTSLCSGNSISLVAGSTEAVSYSWSPGGQTSPSILLDTSGTYVLTVQSINSCTATDSIYINIQGVAPVVAFTTTNQCFGDSLVLVDSSFTLDSSNIVQWDWAFHDGQLAGDSVVKKKYPAPGVYPVTLTVTTDSACSSSATMQVQVHYLPEPAFKWTNPCSDKPIQFINMTQVQGGAQISEYLWIVNGVDSFDVAAPLYQAGGPGLVPVVLSAVSNYGCVNYADTVMEIKVSPVAQFDISPSCTYRKTYFFDQSVAPVYHPIIQWSWNLGVVGAVSSFRNPEYTYYQPGNYDVTLNIKSLNGCNDQYVRTIQVSSSPVAGFAGNEGCAGAPVLLVDTSAVANGYVFSRKWTIDSAGVFSDSLVNLMFADSGHYNFALEVVSELNCKTETTGIITIHPLPQAGFAASSYLGSAPFEVTFTNQSDEGDYTWQFGDGNTSTLSIPVHTFADTGHYNVNLLVTDSNGCIMTSGQSIRVVPNLYDIAILGMDTIVNGNLRNIALILANIGTLPVENPYLVVTLPNSQPFTETVLLTLEPGTIHYYIMATGILASDLIDRSFICARITLPVIYGLEENLSNNEYCLASSGNFRLLRMYPNPASDQLIIEFSSENSGQANMTIQSPAGRRIAAEEIAVSKGLNRLYLDLRDYAQGMYFVSFTYGEARVFGKFVKSGGTQ